MRVSDLFQQRRAPAIVRYAMALASVAVALSITWLLRSYLESSFTPLFFCAIMLTTWYGGLAPGFLSVLLAIVSLDYFFIPPLYFLELTIEKVPRVISFALSALFVSWLSGQQKKTEELLRQARDGLELEVQKRTEDLRRTNQELQAEIAERKGAEVRLRRSEAYLAESQRQSHTGSWAWEVGSNESFWSQETFRIFGLDGTGVAAKRQS